MKKINVDLSVKSFRSILDSSWPVLSKLNEKDVTGSFLIDWMQANWEMVVECSIAPQLNVVLEIYGEGADCNGDSSRVWRPNLKPNYQIICIAKGGTEIVDAISGEIIKGKMIFDEFCTLSEDWISYSPPFDYVNIQGDSPCLIDISLLTFEAWPIE